MKKYIFIYIYFFLVCFYVKTTFAATSSSNDDLFIISIPSQISFNSETKEGFAEVVANNVETSFSISIYGDDFLDDWELIDKTESSNRLKYNIGTSKRK